MRHPPYRPGCYYGGLSLPQKIKKPEDPFYRQKNLMLEGTIPLYKLHGSLSWSFEWQHLVLYADARPAFRQQNVCAIIPPVPEKQALSWLQPIWDAAEASLCEARTWIVCGYSLPDYDLLIRAILQRAGKGQCTTVYVLDPAAEQIRERWQAVTPHAQVIPLPGLPHGTDDLRAHLIG